jgi:hypothetical protein
MSNYYELCLDVEKQMKMLITQADHGFDVSGDMAALETRLLFATSDEVKRLGQKLEQLVKLVEADTRG